MEFCYHLKREGVVMNRVNRAIYRLPIESYKRNEKSGKAAGILLILYSNIVDYFAKSREEGVLYRLGIEQALDHVLQNDLLRRFGDKEWLSKETERFWDLLMGLDQHFLDQKYRVLQISFNKQTSYSADIAVDIMEEIIDEGIDSSVRYLLRNELPYSQNAFVRVSREEFLRSIRNSSNRLFQD